jgi:hypothetical protein
LVDIRPLQNHNRAGLSFGQADLTFQLTMAEAFEGGSGAVVAEASSSAPRSKPPPLHRNQVCGLGSPGKAENRLNSYKGLRDLQTQEAQMRRLVYDMGETAFLGIDDSYSVSTPILLDRIPTCTCPANVHCFLNHTYALKYAFTHRHSRTTGLRTLQQFGQIVSRSPKMRMVWQFRLDCTFAG